MSSIVGLHLPVFSVLGKEIDIAEGLADAIPTLRVFVSEASKKFMDAAKGCNFEKTKIPILVKAGVAIPFTLLLCYSITKKSVKKY